MLDLSIPAAWFLLLQCRYLRLLQYSSCTCLSDLAPSATFTRSCVPLAHSHCSTLWAMLPLQAERLMRCNDHHWLTEEFCWCLAISNSESALLSSSTSRQSSPTQIRFFLISIYKSCASVKRRLDNADHKQCRIGDLYHCCASLAMMLPDLVTCTVYSTDFELYFVAL